MGGAILAVALSLVSSISLYLVQFFTRIGFVNQYAGSLVDILARMQNPELVNKSLRSRGQKTELLIRFLEQFNILTIVTDSQKIVGGIRSIALMLMARECLSIFLYQGDVSPGRERARSISQTI